MGRAGCCCQVHERKPPDGFRGQVQSCAKGQAHVKVFSLHKDGKTDALVASWPVQEVEKWLVPEGTEMTQKAYTEQLFRKP
ncbi:hypothetical protein HaLaN_08716 [Haematococcus lacustris]|uniref:Uncharacterized protein n=1 Tax=Haematococcus lacustris TaxID=44745 RepID=A0A699Z1N3_HAELA|nr:hypothetical protein HaLaN_08716 [Haematococcus lacustris]